MNRDEIDKYLEDMWDWYEPDISMDINDKVEILYNIRQRILSLSPEKKKINFNKWFKIAAAVLLLFSLSLPISLLLKSNSSSQFTVTTERGQKTQILLPDSTRVWLNSDSRLIYASDFNIKNRKVRLEGEGYFQVKKDDKNKFEVKTGKINIIVYGTVFNVSAYSADSTIEVSLESGKVILEKEADKTIIAEMYPDQKVLISKYDLSHKVVSCDASLAGIWHENKLIFVNAPAKDVFKKMELWYGMNIHVVNPDSTIRYGFTLKSESMREMLELLNIITPITYRVTGEEVYVKYK